MSEKSKGNPMTEKTDVKLSDLQLEIVMHRLTAGDTIAAVLTDVPPDTYKGGTPCSAFVEATIIQVQSYLIENKEIPACWLPPLDGRLTPANIIEDSLDGSTFFACLNSDPKVTPERMNAYTKAADLLEEETGVDIPRN